MRLMIFCYFIFSTAILYGVNPYLNEGYILDHNSVKTVNRQSIGLKKTYMTIDELVMGPAENRLVTGINDMAHRQAIYAYNIANTSTQGFVPIRFKDEYEGVQKFKYPLTEVNMEEEMARLTKSRLRHSAYVKLLSMKMSITRKIAALGKGG